MSPYQFITFTVGAVSIKKDFDINPKHLTIASGVQGIIDLTVPAGGSSLSVEMGVDANRIGIT